MNVKGRTGITFFPVTFYYTRDLHEFISKQNEITDRLFPSFFSFSQVLAMWGVMRFYNLLRIGVTWKGPEVIELWYNASDSSKGSVGGLYRMEYDVSMACKRAAAAVGSKGKTRKTQRSESTAMTATTTTTTTTTEDEDDNEHRMEFRTIKFYDPTYDDDNDDGNKSAGSGSDEDDSLLVAYDSNSISSVWHCHPRIAATQPTKRNETDQHIPSLYKTSMTLLTITIVCCIEIYAQFILIL